MRAIIRLFLSTFALSAIVLIGIFVKSSIATFSPVLAGVFGFIFLSLPTLVAIWSLVKHHFQPRWYK
jgi:hypothetical protein